jgi:2-polyprenyl-6-methoxyphenol hydroxylase-like FAD-dependent oxidoreductase
MAIKKILIIGAGISGLSLAVNLKKLHIPFRIIEKQENWGKKGLAMSIQGEGLDAAASMGILKELEIYGKKRNLQRIENANGRILKQLEPVEEDHSFVISRDILHETLRSRVSEIEMGLTVLDLEKTEHGINVLFSNDSSDNFSLVVGADGINSKISKFITVNNKQLGKKENTIYSGSVLWGITVTDKYLDIIEIWDKDTMIAFYPVIDGTVISFIKKVPGSFSSGRADRADHIKKYFSSYFQEIIKRILDDLPKEIFFDHIRYTRPDKWNKGRITLIGDACHSLSPLSGLGANLAMADAIGLSQVIASSDPQKNLLLKLEEYNNIRQMEADKAYYLSKFRTRRSMENIPGRWIRNIKMKLFKWIY